MSINIELPDEADLKPKITVIGVGGAGGNAVNNMIESNLEGVDFWVANTDAQALDNSVCKNRIQLGAQSTRGLGAGAHPEIGKKAAEESISELEAIFDGTNMVFITAGMGGGTGTGAAPVIARVAKEKGILTVGVVTKPFHFEGVRRMKLADDGLDEFNNHVDTLIVIPNQNLFRIANENTTFGEAFKMADDVLHSGVRGITDLITMPGLINLDFADIRTVMSEMGKAMMGTGEAEGENRAVLAAEAAISNPLLDHSSMKGAHGVLINITGGSDMTLYQVDAAANRIKEEVDSNANIIFGSAFNPNLDGKLRVSVVATGIETVGGIKPQVQNNLQPENIISTGQSEVKIEESIEEEKTVVYTSTEAEQPAQEQRDYSYIHEDDSNQRGEELDDEDSFVAPKALEPSSFESPIETSADFEVEEAVNANEDEPEHEERIAVGQDVGIVPDNSDVRVSEENSKKSNDFFDIPAFIRNRMKK